MILRYQRAQRHGTKVTNCINLYLLIQVGLFFVDDGELLEAAQNGKELPERVAKRLQVLVNSYVCELVLK